MNPTPLVVLSVALSAAVSTGIALALAPSADSADPKTGTAATAADLEGLKREIEALEAALAEQRQQAMTVRQPAEVPDERIRAIVRELLRAEDGTAEPAGRAAPLAVHVDAIVAELAEVGTHSARGQELWRQAQEAGRVDELVDALQRRARENPGSADAQADLGDALVQKLMTADNQAETATLGMAADAAYTEALELDPTHWRARFAKAVGYTFWPDFLGKKTEAIRHFEILLEQQESGAPQDGYDETYLFLGNLYDQRGEAEKARSVWERGLRLHPGSAGLKERLGR